MPDELLNVAHAMGNDGTLFASVNDKIILGGNTRCWPKCLYIDVIGAGQFAPGNVGPIPYYRFIAPSSPQDPSTQPWGNTILDLCSGKAAYCATGWIGPFGNRMVYVQIGPSNLINPFGGVGSCDMCDSNYAILLSFWLNYPFFPIAYLFQPGLNGQVNPQPFPNFNGPLPNFYWDDCIYCKEVGGVCAPPNLDGLQFDLCADIWWYTATIHTCLPPSWSDMGFAINNDCTARVFENNLTQWNELVANPGQLGPF